MGKPAMNPTDFYNFLKELFNWDPERLAAFFTGCAVTVVVIFFAWWMYWRFFGRSRGQRMANLSRERRQLAEKNSELQSRNAELTHRLDSRESELQKLQYANEAL